MPVSRKLEQVIKLIENDLTNVRNDFLGLMANNLVDLSIATIHGGTGSDTGAYMESHSITQSKGAGRARSSRNKPTAANPAAIAEQARQMLANDIAALPVDTTNVYMNNNSPHAQSVERGKGWRGKAGYAIYTRTKREAKNFLQQAVNMNKR
jgi:hypothetical protein